MCYNKKSGAKNPTTDINIITNSTMTQRLKRWESPRRQGRNDKGRGGAARQRQLKKREKLLRKTLKAQAQKNQQNSNNSGGEDNSSPSFFWLF
jgi:hypothetical protein